MPAFARGSRAFFQISAVTGPEIGERPLVQGLADAGVKELLVIAQDITRYGIDLYGRRRLAELLTELCRLPFHWIRLHYLYPDEIDGELIDVIAREPKIVKYLDIPIQHLSDKILKSMHRQ